MSNGTPYADLIILAMIAVFILLRLRSVLGDKTGHDSPNHFNKTPNAEPREPEPIVQLKDTARSPVMDEEKEDPVFAKIEDPGVKDVLAEIKKKDPQFNATAFLQGAKMAYEMVFDAFANGDRKALKMLLANDIFETFVKALDDRDSGERKEEVTLVSVEPRAIVDAELDGTVARITVCFESEQVTVERDDKGEVIKGSASDVSEAEDDWVFERDVMSKNPNWGIVET